MSKFYDQGWQRMFTPVSEYKSINTLHYTCTSCTLLTNSLVTVVWHLDYWYYCTNV